MLYKHKFMLCNVHVYLHWEGHATEYRIYEKSQKSMKKEKQTFK